MYQIKCDNYILYDPRDEDFVVDDPKCKLEVNTVGEASFAVFASHPHYNKIKKMRSVIEILQDGDVIFRGRPTSDTADFDNIKAVDVEGVGAYFNDSIVRPFVFPDEHLEKPAYKTAASSGNVVEYFLSWLIDNHNSQVEEFQRFKLGKVTVTDSTNLIIRSATDYAKTWETLKSKLFGSELGGYLCIRYEADGNYIDYLDDFELTNIQRVRYGENLLDLSTESDATNSFSAVLPLGKKRKEIDANTDDDSRLNIAELADGDVTSDIYKQGDLLISRSAKEAYGLIIAPTKETTWDDVTLARNLRTKGAEYLATTASKLSNTIEIKAVDLHFSDADVEAFRVYRYIEFDSMPHGHEGRYKLSKLDIDILNPQNTKITLGDTTLSMTDINKKTTQSLEDRVASVVVQANTQGIGLSEVQSIVTSQTSSFVTTCEEIVFTSMKDYVETGNYTQFKETVETQLKVLSDAIVLNFTTTTDQINNVNGDLQEKFNQITKYFTFNVDGLTIGQADNPYQVVIDNDRYSMQVNGYEVLWLDSEGKAHIPELDVTTKFDLFGLVITQDETGNINCEYGGDA